jgi:transposase-like protein
MGIYGQRNQTTITVGRLYEEIKDAGFVCRRCGISKPTLRKWWRRYQSLGIDGLKSHSRRPHNSPNTKIGEKEEKLIFELRHLRNLGPRRLQSELLRLHSILLAIASIHKVLKKHDVKPVKRIRKKSEYIRYGDEAHKGSKLQDTFELFARDFLSLIGCKILTGPYPDWPISWC